MSLPHFEKAKQQHYMTGLDLEPPEQEPGDVTLTDIMQSGLRGNNWRGWPIVNVGEKCMAYATGAAEGL